MRACVLVVAVVAGCAGNPFADLQPGIGVTWSGGKSFTIYARFLGAPLPSDATLTATYAGTTTSINRATPSTSERYHFFDTVATAGPPDGAAIAVTLTIGGADATSTVTMPPSFTFESMTGSITTPPLTVTWAPIASDTMEWWLVGTDADGTPCTGGASFGDTGSLTLQSYELHPTGSNPIGCPPTAALYRFRYGTIDTQFERLGVIMAMQERALP